MYINDRASKYFVNIILGLILLVSTCNSSNLFMQEYEPLNNNSTRQLEDNPEGNLFSLIYSIMSKK